MAAPSSSRSKKMPTTITYITEDPFGPSKCDSILEPDDLTMGLDTTQKMFRYESGPPIFGTRAAYEAARGIDGATNPHGLQVLFVNLREDLQADEYEEHYREVYARSKALCKKGVEGTGIVFDGSDVGPRPQDKWIMYFAVFGADVVNELRKDPKVIDCGLVGNELVKPSAIQRVPNWAHEALSKTH
ncbi:hypothetical protein BJ508DRAFT_326275 [Ascobolus immersus RN42]|uniref:Uncharacterized protein n=1 Tax=Ascobolus immersus RN42 TaxID=1160509 RepID=A0A3N4I7Y8_ASCIM|nr:hypothetical protein BJ508DRAFT_326275 [Ascobolus immersus RN42]